MGPGAPLTSGELILWDEWGKQCEPFVLMSNVHHLDCCGPECIFVDATGSHHLVSTEVTSQRGDILSLASSIQSSLRGVVRRCWITVVWGSDTCNYVLKYPHLIIPRHISLPLAVTAVACSDSHALIATKSSVYALGHGSYGQLGLGESVLSTDQLQELTLQPGESPRSIAVSNYHSCLVTAPYGHLYTFGCGAFYRLGHGEDDTNYFHPHRVESLLSVGAWQPDGSSTGIAQVCCGLWHTVVLTTGMRDVYVWGWNNFGQCGDESTAADGDTSTNSGHSSRLHSRSEIDGSHVELVAGQHGQGSQKKFKMLIEPTRLSSLDSLFSSYSDVRRSDGFAIMEVDEDNEEDDEDSVVEIAAGSRFTALRTQHGHLLVMGQLGSNEIDKVDGGVDWWLQNFQKPSSYASSSATPGMAQSPSQTTPPESLRALRFLHFALDYDELSRASEADAAGNVVMLGRTSFRSSGSNSSLLALAKQQVTAGNTPVTGRKRLHSDSANTPPTAANSNSGSKSNNNTAAINGVGHTKPPLANTQHISTTDAKNAFPVNSVSLPEPPKFPVNYPTAAVTALTSTSVTSPTVEEGRRNSNSGVTANANVLDTAAPKPMKVRQLVAYQWSLTYVLGH